MSAMNPDEMPSAYNLRICKKCKNVFSLFLIFCPFCGEKVEQ